MIEQELDVYLRARCTLLVLVTPEEERALQTVKAVCERGKRACLTWDVADGFHALTPGASAPAARDPLSALEQVDKADGDVLFVLKDFHECWSNAQIKRKLRGVAQRLKFSKKSIVVLTPAAKLPEELKDEAVVVEFPPPTAAELEAVLARLAKTPGVKVNLTKLGHEKLVQAALGLTAAQAQRVFAKAIVSDGVLDDRDIDRVTEEKKQIIRESEALEFYPVTETAADVGGLGVLKEWLRLRERAFTQEARDYGLPSPKGIALIGIPGCVRGDTRILLADGRMPTIEFLARQCTETLAPGVYPVAVDVVGGDGQPKRATELHVYANQPTLIVRLAAGHEIEVTREHPLLTNRGWTRAAELCEGDRVALHFGHPVERWQPKVTDFSSFSSVLRKCRVEVTLPTVLDTELAAWLGALTAEGSTEHGRVTFSIHLAEEDFASWIESTSEHLFAIRPVRQRVRADKQSQNLRLSSVPVTLNVQPFVPAARARRAPDLIFRTAQDLEVAAYLRGLFEGDGGARLAERTKLVSLKTSSLGLARDAQLLLARLKIPSAMYVDKKTQCWRLSIQSRFSIDAFAQQVGFISKAKRRQLQEVCASYRRHTRPRELKCSAVVSVEPSWQDRVYDLHVPDGHAFVANGVINHNTGKSLTAKMIAGLWRLPLLRLDVGALFGSLVGESEERARRALRLAETVAPCLSGDTRVTLADGTEQTIEALYDQRPEELKVLGMTRQFQLQPVAVLGITRRPAPDLYRVRLTHGELRATSNHLHPALREGRLLWVRTDALTPHDHIAVPRQVPTSDRYPAMVEFLPAEARLYAAGALSYARAEFRTPQRKYSARRRGADFVRVGELVSLNERPRLDEVRRIACGRGGTAESVLNRLPEHLNDDIGYLLGLITSDGYLGKERRIGFINTQQVLHGLFAEIMGRQFGLKVSFRVMQPARNDPPALPGTGPESRFAECYSSFTDNLLARRILGEVRARLLALPTPFLRSWLRGHFDGDGCVSAPPADPKCTISAKVPTVNRLVRSALHRVGLPTTNHPSHNIEITGLENVLRFIEEIGSSHPAKQARMAAWRTQAGRPECKDRTDPVPVGSLLRSARKELGMGSQHFRATSCSLISYYERGIIHPNRERLRSIIGELAAWAREHRKDAPAAQTLRTLVEAPILWGRVLSVGPEEMPEFVYDLICEPPHTFVANGIVTHNCIVWVDELEKAMAHGGSDSGTSTRVFGTILTWTQEKKAPVFVVATANDISSLPPELLRKGRFDEIFFLDLPTLAERREIFAVHLQKRKRLAQDHDLDRLARESEGYVGAEIEQAIIDAMYAGFGAGREFTTDDVSAALRRQVPLSVSQRETIGALRAWLKEGRAQSASFQEAQEAEQQFVPLDLGNR